MNIGGYVPNSKTIYRSNVFHVRGKAFTADLIARYDLIPRGIRAISFKPQFNKTGTCICFYIDRQVCYVLELKKKYDCASAGIFSYPI